jgi:general secretion pathway protein G
MVATSALSKVRVNFVNVGIVLAVVSSVSAFALPTYSRIIDDQRNHQAQSEVQHIHSLILQRRVATGHLPQSLAEIAGVPTADPWGRAYIYIHFEQSDLSLRSRRRDENLLPINTEFDLYSRGSNGISEPPLNAAASRDDIVIANDGTFAGLARDF